MWVTSTTPTVSSLWPYHPPMLKTLPLWVYKHRVDTQATLCVCAVNLRHWELQFHRLVGLWGHKITCVVQDPAPGLLQVALRQCLLTVGGWELEADRLLIPTMDMLWAAMAAAKAFVELPKMDPEVQAISSNRKAEIDFANHLKPPDLLKVSYRLESAWKKFGSYWSDIWYQ